MSENAYNEEVKQVSVNDPNILQKLVNTLYLNSGSALIGSMLGVAILIVIFLEHVSLGALVVWGGYMLVVSLGRYSLLRNYKSSTCGAKSSSPWAVYFYTGAAMNGLGWGAAVWVLFTPDALLQAIVYITLAGIMAAGVVALAARHMAVICFLAPITIIGLSRLVSVNETIHFALAAMLSIFSVFLYRFAQMTEQTLIDSFKLRYENKSLLEYLESSNDKLTNTTQKYMQLNTELTKMRDEVLGLARAKSEFLATMSHEIRTPMNGVLGMIELLLGTRLSEQQQRFAETVRRSGETLLSIINNILDFSKIEAGKLSLEQADFNLRDLVEDLGGLFSARAHGKGLELACSVPGDIPEAMVGDATRLRQILTNLIGNAIKFTETGEVLIDVQALKETPTAVRVRFAIKDTGIGLEPSQINHIFDSFSQGDGSTTRKYGGTGLGLAISRQLVGLMGGQLDVESVTGQGSTFAFELDLEKQPTSRATSPSRPVNDFSKLHVLVVDDNATNLEILSHHLETWSIQHTCTESGPSALQLLHAEVASNNPYNMVILDYHMPEMDGLEVARKISTDSLLSSIRMVMFSSVDDVVLQQNSLDLGIDYSITKPVRQSELYDCLINRSVSDYRSTEHDSNDEDPVLTSDPESMQILVVEDNEVNQAVAIGMLRKLGYRGVHTANNGRDALDKVEQTHYDLILMDMQMPVMDGYQATTALREREQTGAVATDGAAILHTPVVALTANALEGDREHCLEAGADDYLSKPFSPMDLGKLLEKWLPQTGTRDASAISRGVLTEAEPPGPGPVQDDEPGTEISASPIDQSVLDVIRDMEDEDDPDMLADILGLYLDKSADLLQTLQTAIANLDAESMRIAAHTLKSSSANVGARVLADLCRDLIAQLGNWEIDTKTLAMTWSEEVYRILSVEQASVTPSLAALLSLIHDEDREQVRHWFSLALKTGGGHSINHRVMSPRGGLCNVFQQVEAIIDLDGNVTQLHGTLQDITERQKFEDRIRELAYFDSLTGLPNRESFMMHVDQSIKSASRHKHELAALFLDLDNFKRINDTLGHTIGDLLLKAIAERLQECLRSSDIDGHDTDYVTTNMVSRFGGDEFTMLLTEIHNSDVAAIVSQRVMESLMRPLNLANHEVVITPTIGIAVFPEDGNNSEVLFRNSDTAMYAAKRNGKNQFQFYNKAMNANAKERLTMESQLRNALEHKELQLHYQPQMELDNGRVVGVEALLRWQNKKLGNVPPDTFIPIAEDSGLIIPIGEWVLRTACTQLKAWQDTGVPIVRVAVNISVRQFMHPRFFELVKQVIEDTGLDPESLELEITESLLMQDVETAIHLLRELKAIGIQLAIDDFGTGYSSLSYLKRYPIDQLKVDKAFVQDITTNFQDAAITKAVIAMGNNMDLRVIAEGVETEDQLNYLTDKQCHEVQGYYLSKPIPAHEVCLFIDEHNNTQQDKD